MLWGPVRSGGDQGWAFAVNTVAATLATIVSGPLNYAANAQYATSSRQDQPSVWTSLRGLYRECVQQPTLLTKLHHFQTAMRIGTCIRSHDTGVANEG